MPIFPLLNKVLDLPNFSVSPNQSGGNSAVDKRKKQHHALQKRNQRGQRRLRRSPGGKERGGGRTVQSFRRILRKEGARLCFSSFDPRNGLASLFLLLVGHTLVYGHRPPDFSGIPGFPRSWERIDRNGRERRSRAQREPGPGEVWFGRSSGARPLGSVQRVDRAHQRPPNSSSDVSYLLLPPSTNYKRGKRGSNP